VKRRTVTVFLFSLCHAENLSYTDCYAKSLSEKSLKVDHRLWRAQSSRLPLDCDLARALELLG